MPRAQSWFASLASILTLLLRNFRRSPLLLTFTFSKCCAQRCFILKNTSAAICDHFHAHGTFSGELGGAVCALKERVFRKQLITVAGFGGSVSVAGHANFEPFSKLFSDWLAASYGTTVHFHNLAIGGTGPSYPSLCLHDQLHGVQPDIVFLEFSINLGAPEELQRLIDGCFSLRSSPAVFYVDTFTQLGNEDQFLGFLNGSTNELPTLKKNLAFLQVVNKNHLPYFSLGSAFEHSSAEARALLAAHVFADDRHHLTVFGHSVFAELLAAFFDYVIKNDCQQTIAPTRLMYPPTLCFSYYVQGAGAPIISMNRGNWSVQHALGHNKIGLRPQISTSENIGAFVAFYAEYAESYDMLGIGAMVNSVKDLNGRVSISFDGTPIGEFDGYADFPWNIQQIRGYALPTTRPGVHQVSITVLNSTSSGGYDFALTTIAFYTTGPPSS